MITFERHAHRPKDHSVHLLWAPAGAVLLWLIPTGSTGLTLCPFALITGTACPGCGLTRAAGSLLRGDLGASIAYHPLAMLVAIWVASAWLIGLARASGRVVSVDQRLLNRLLVATGMLFVVIWLLRMATGTLPPV